MKFTYYLLYLGLLIGRRIIVPYPHNAEGGRASGLKIRRPDRQPKAVYRPAVQAHEHA